jgi:membrane associated rhomboid family serine protease
MGGLIPLGDASRRSSRIPLVTSFIILANVYVFLLELQGGNAFVHKWALIPNRIMHGRALITIATSMFLHGSWMHIIGNMVFLWAFGPEIEDAMGRGRYLVFYFVGGLVAMLSQTAADPFSRIPNLGASGAIAAVMGAFIVTFPRDRIRTFLFFFIFFRIAFIPAAVLIGFWFVIQLFDAGAISAAHATGGVAYLAHIGGFLFGVLTGRLFEDPRRVAWLQSMR